MKVLKTVFWTVTVIICLTIVAGNFAEFQLNSYEDVTPTELLVLQKLEGEELDVCTGDYSLVDTDRYDYYLVAGTFYNNYATNSFFNFLYRCGVRRLRGDRQHLFSLAAVRPILRGDSGRGDDVHNDGDGSGTGSHRHPVLG